MTKSQLKKLKAQKHNISYVANRAFVEAISEKRLFSDLRSRRTINLTNQKITKVQLVHMLSVMMAVDNR